MGGLALGPAAEDHCLILQIGHDLSIKAARATDENYKRKPKSHLNDISAAIYLLRRLTNRRAPL